VLDQPTACSRRAYESMSKGLASSAQTRIIAVPSSSCDPAATVPGPLPWTKLSKAFLSKMRLSSSSSVPNKYLIQYFMTNIISFSKTHIYFRVLIFQTIDIRVPAFLSLPYLESRSVFLSPLFLTRKDLTSSSPLVGEQQSMSRKGSNLLLTSALGLLIYRFQCV